MRTIRGLQIYSICSLSQNTTTESNIFFTSSMCFKYACLIPLQDKTGKFIVEAFDTINERSRNLWVERGGELYNKTMDRWLKENDIHRYLTYSEGKAVVVERFNQTLKTRMWKYLSANDTYIYIAVLVPC